MKECNFELDEDLYALVKDETRSGEERDQRRAAAIAEARAASAQALKDGENALAQKREKTAENLQAATPELAELLAERLFSKE